jgi:hypothetical protein
MSAIFRATRWAAVVALSMSVAACGGGGGGDAPAPTPTPVPPPAPAPAPTPVSATGLQFGGFASSDAPPNLSDTSRMLAVTAMAYDATHDQLIATVADTAGPTLEGLDPITLATRWTLPAPDLASRISISDDGSTAYFALPSSGSVWQVDLTNRVAVRSIQVGDTSRSEGALSISIRPGHPGTVAVSIGLLATPTQHFVQTNVYDDGVMRPKSTGSDGDYLTPDTLAEIAFTDADHVVGYDTQSTNCTLTRMALQPDGLQPILSAKPFGIYAECFGDGLTFSAGRLITNSGSEVNPNTLAFLRAWPSVGAPGAGFLDLFTGTWVRISSGSYTGQDAVPVDGRVYATTRVSVEEIEPQRLTLRRSVLTQEPFQLSGGPETEGMATFGSHIAFTVFDPVTGNIAVHSADLSSVPALGHASFPVSTVSATGAVGLSLQMPGVAMASDPARHRLVVALDGGIGPDGNSLAVVNPDTGVVESIIPLSDRPIDVKVSSTGSIAYVSHLNAIPTLDRVDLVSGQVTSLAVRADSFAIKEDDPQSVVVLDYYQNYSLTAVHDMSVVGAPIDLRATTGLTDVGRIASNGPNQLVGFVSDIGGGNDLAHFSWTRDGVTYSGSGTLTMGLNGTGIQAGFGKLWTLDGPSDLTTGQQSGTFPGVVGSVGAVAPTSVTSAIIFTAADYDALSWLQSTPDGSWVSAFTLPVSDTAWSSGISFYGERATALDANEVALRILWIGEPRTSAEPSHIYIVKRTPS